MELMVDARVAFVEAKGVLSSPKKFFKKAKKDKSWKEAFSFALVVALAGHVLTALYNIFLYPIVAPFLSQAFGVPISQFSVGQVVTAAVVSYVMTLAMSFIWGGALKVWLALFRTPSSFNQSYRVMAYSRTPNYLFNWIPFVNLFAALYSFYLLMVGLQSEYGMSKKKALIIILSSIVITFILFLLLVSLVPTI
jgi:hypothetical protein